MHDISIRVRYVGRGAGCIVWPRIESPENRSLRLFERTIDEYFVSRRAIEKTKLVEASRRRVQFDGLFIFIRRNFTREQTFEHRRSIIRLVGSHFRQNFLLKSISIFGTITREAKRLFQHERSSALRSFPFLPFKNRLNST